MVQKVNGGQEICSRGASVGNRKNCEKHAQCSKGKWYNLFSKEIKLVMIVIYKLVRILSFITETTKDLYFLYCHQH